MLRKLQLRFFFHNLFKPSLDLLILMNEEKNKIEAVLFTTGRYLSIEEISKMTGIGSLGYLKEALAGLKKDYETRTGALELVEQGERWKLNIKKTYLFLTESLLSDCELDKPTQETLAIIAYKNPLFQNELVKIRGTTAYDHVRILKELDFITSEPSGRTRILKITNKFYDYFDVVEDQLQKKLASLNHPQDVQPAQEASNGNQEH